MRSPLSSPDAAGSARASVAASASASASDSVVPAAATTAEPTIPSTPSGDDLLIVGPGVLGSYLGLLWKTRHPRANVVGQTNTTTSHDKLKSLGIAPRTSEEAAGSSAKYPRVLFAAPPSGSADFVAEIEKAISLWDRDAPGACFVYTGSAAVYDVDDGSHCNEDSPLVQKGKSERTDKLLAAEDAVLGAGGCVLRLAGLYHAQRGAHTFFLRMGTVDRWGGYTVNLLHYEDAARLAEAVLSGAGLTGSGDGGGGAPSRCSPSPSPPSSWRSRAFLGTDGAPITFQDMCDAAVASGSYKTSTPVKFTAEEGASTSRGKLMSNAATREALGGEWQPKYSSFEAFVASGAVDVYGTDARLGGGVGAAHAG